MDSKHKFVHILRTMFTTGMAYVVNYGITLVLTPYITGTVGPEAYGFVSLAKQFGQYAVIITTALNTYAARYIGIAYHRTDKRKANVYFSSVFWGDIILASVILTAASGLIFFLDHLIYIPGEIVTDVKLLFLFVFVSLWVSTVFSAFGCAAYIRNKLDITGVFKTISYMTNAVVLAVCYILFPAHVFYVGIGMTASTFIVALADFGIARKFTPELWPKRTDFSISAVKRLVMEGCWASFSSVGELLNNGLDLLVCNQMLSSLAMGQIAIAKTMNTIVQSLYAVVDQAFFPMFLKSYAENKKERLLDELKISMKISGYLANIAFAGFVALGLAYYRLWIPNQDIDLIYKLTIVTILTCIPSGAIHPLYYVYTLTVKKALPCLVTIIGGIFNVVGMYILIKYAGMGVYAVAWTTVIVMAFINFVTNPLYMAHVLKVPWMTFYQDIIRNALACLGLTAIFKWFSSLYMPSSWLTLIVCIMIYALIGLPIHLVIVCNKRQWKILLNIFRKKKLEVL